MVEIGLNFAVGAVAYFVLSFPKQNNSSTYKAQCGNNKKFKEFLVNWVGLTSTGR